MIPTRFTVFALAATTLAALTVTPAEAETKVELLKEAGKRIERAYSNRDPDSPYDDKTLKKLRESTAACLKAIDDALAAGGTLENDVQMPHGKFPNVRQIKNEFNSWVYVAPLSEGQAYCRTLAAKPDMLQLDGQLQQTDAWIKKSVSVRAAAEATTALDNQSRDTAEAMVNQVEPCRVAVDRAIKAGVAKSTPLELKHVGRVTVGEARVKVCDALTVAAKAILDIEAAKLEKMLAPYKAALKGEKLAKFVEREMIFDTIYGKGGKMLDTPAKLANAPAWFILMSGDIGLGLKSLTVRRYLWSGNKLKSIKEQTGCCTL
jgi:hypothetical protein